MIEFNATLIVAMISFVVFMFIMNAIFYRPILSIIRKREGYIESNYQDSKKISNSADEITSEYNNKLNQAKDEARHQTSVMMEEVQKVEFEKIKKAKENSKVQIQSKKDELEHDKQELKERVNTEVISQLASDITSKILGKSNG